MARPQATAMLAMEVFVEQHELAPVRVRGKTPILPMTWTAAMRIREKEAGQADGEVTSDVLQVHPPS